MGLYKGRQLDTDRRRTRNASADSQGGHRVEDHAGLEVLVGCFGVLNILTLTIE